MLNDRDNKFQGQEESEYHFSDEDANYEIEETEEEASKSASSGLKESKESIFTRLTRSKRMLISLVVFLGLIFLVYKMVSPNTSTPVTDISSPLVNSSVSANNQISKTTTKLRSTKTISTPLQAASPSHTLETQNGTITNSPLLQPPMQATQTMPVTSSASNTPFMAGEEPAQRQMQAMPMPAMQPQQAGQYQPVAQTNYRTPPVQNNVSLPAQLYQAQQREAQSTMLPQQPLPLQNQQQQLSEGQYMGPPASAGMIPYREPIQAGAYNSSMPQSMPQTEMARSGQTVPMVGQTTMPIGAPANFPADQQQVNPNNAMMPSAPPGMNMYDPNAYNNAGGNTANLNATSMQLMGQLQAQYVQRLNEFATQNKNLQDQVSSLNSRVVTMESELNQLLQVLTRQTQGRPARPAATPSSPPPSVEQPHVSYNVQAIIPGRAWLKSLNGETLTVAEGDMIRSLGRVSRIDPYDGVVEINTGTRMISLSYGNGS